MSVGWWLEGELGVGGRRREMSRCICERSVAHIANRPQALLLVASLRSVAKPIVYDREGVQ